MSRIGIDEVVGALVGKIVDSGSEEILIEVGHLSV
jgi:hypothetical protein